MFGILSKIETSPYPSCPRHAHHTVTVRSWLHLYFQYSISEMLMSIRRSAVATLTVKSYTNLAFFTQSWPHDRSPYASKKRMIASNYKGVGNE